jgi:hypothetical protein
MEDQALQSELLHFHSLHQGCKLKVLGVDVTHSRHMMGPAKKLPWTMSCTFCDVVCISFALGTLLREVFIVMMVLIPFAI